MRNETKKVTLPTLMRQISQRIQKALNLMRDCPNVQVTDGDATIYLTKSPEWDIVVHISSKKDCFPDEFFLAQDKLSEANAKKIAKLFNKFIFEVSIPISGTGSRLRELGDDILYDYHNINACSKGKPIYNYEKLKEK